MGAIPGMCLVSGGQDGGGGLFRNFWVGGWVSKHPPPPGGGTILGPLLFPKSGWVGLVIPPPP